MSSFKIDKFMKKDDLPEFFRQLADALEKGEGGELACAEDFQRIKISARKEYGQISLRAKIKSPSECRDEELDYIIEEIDAEEAASGEAPKPKYKALKKRMGASFKVIFKMIHQGTVPPQAAVEEFLADSKLMVSYPGYGDPYYDMYMAACEDFAAAYETGDIAQLNKAVDALVHQKGHCHAKYK